ncbi:MAG: hypothetical protein AB8G99_19955 [Planctomycetaceae bacterium]
MTPDLELGSTFCSVSRLFDFIAARPLGESADGDVYSGFTLAYTTAAATNFSGQPHM